MSDDVFMDYDPVKKAFKDASERIEKMKKYQPKTLIDSISEKDWKGWDASKENPTVRDFGCLEGE